MWRFPQGQGSQGLYHCPLSTGRCLAALHLIKHITSSGHRLRVRRPAFPDDFGLHKLPSTPSIRTTARVAEDRFRRSLSDSTPRHAIAWRTSRPTSINASLNDDCRGDSETVESPGEMLRHKHTQLHGEFVSLQEKRGRSELYDGRHTSTQLS